MPEQISPLSDAHLDPAQQLFEPLSSHTLSHEFPIYDTTTVLPENIITTEGLQTERTNASEAEAIRTSKVSKLGRSIGARAITEVVGIGVDVGLMAAGGVGIAPFSSVIGRETTASTIDVGLMNKLSNNHEKHGEPQSRIRRIGHFALAMAAAVTAQKLGPDLVTHISANIDHGLVGQFGVPLASKISATAGVNSLAKRVL